MSLTGGKIAGGNPTNQRVEHDFYATNPKAVEMLFNNYDFKAKNVLEPCVGQGHIADFIKHYAITKNKNIDITCVDLVDRGYPNTIVQDYLTWKPDKKFDGIITNAPFSLAQEFIAKSIKLLDDNGQLAVFLKIQFLEGVKRKEFFDKFPPKYVYVFRQRMATWNNGKQSNSEGKKWATTMCHAWFVWEKENGVMSNTEPIVRWLDNE